MATSTYNFIDMQPENNVRNTSGKLYGKKKNKVLEVSGRSFGDISNRVRGDTTQKNLDPNIKEKLTIKSQKKKQLQTIKGSSKDVANKDGGIKILSPFPEPDFRPEITETEDYEDVLPQQFKLSNEQMDRFTRFWETKPKIKTVTPSPPSPHPNLLELLCPIDVPVSPHDMLYPVENELDVFSLPPPVLTK